MRDDEHDGLAGWDGDDDEMGILDTYRVHRPL